MTLTLELSPEREAALKAQAQAHGMSVEHDDAAFVSVWDLIQQARDLSRWMQEHRESDRRWKETLGVERRMT